MICHVEISQAVLSVQMSGMAFRLGYAYSYPVDLSPSLFPQSEYFFYSTSVRIGDSSGEVPWTIFTEMISLLRLYASFS